MDIKGSVEVQRVGEERLNRSPARDPKRSSSGEPDEATGTEESAVPARYVLELALSIQP